MQNKNILNLVLLSALLILGSIAYFSTQQTGPVIKLGNMARSQVNRIQIQYQSKNIVIERNQGRWLITQPVKIEADTFRLDSILNLVEQPVEKPHTLQANEKYKFGLDNPGAVLTLQDQVFKFGTASALGEKQYLETNGQLHLVDNQIFALITSGYHNLVRRYLLPENARISKISFNNTVISKNKQGSWIQNSKNYDSDTLKSFVDNWTLIQAFTVQPAHTEITGTRVVIEFNNAQQRIFHVQQTDSNTLVYRDDLNLIFQFHHSAYDSLLNPEHSAAEVKAE